MYLVNILCNDRRVRSTALGFFIPFLILVTLERFYSTFLSVFYIFGVTAITFGSIGFRHYQYGVQAFLLGIVAGYSLVINMSSDHQNMAIFSRYTLMLSLFHFTEALFTGLTNNENLKSDSFLLNHSVQYWLAAVASWLEFGLESIGMPWINSNYVSYFGVLLCFSGEVIRKVSMWHAKSVGKHTRLDS
jgi:protein-S-isoprenylcysteine O-methyltransferase